MRVGSDHNLREGQSFVNRWLFQTQILACAPVSARPPQGQRWLRIPPNQGHFGGRLRQNATRQCAATGIPSPQLGMTRFIPNLLMSDLASNTCLGWRLATKAVARTVKSTRCCLLNHLEPLKHTPTQPQGSQPPSLGGDAPGQ